MRGKLENVYTDFHTGNENNGRNALSQTNRRKTFGSLSGNDTVAAHVHGSI